MVNYDCSKKCLRCPDNYKNLKLDIKKAKTFLNNNGLNTHDCNFQYIISENYLDDIERYCIDFNKDKYNDSNGTFIHTSNLKTGNIPILIFNWKKISDTCQDFIISVYIHEFIHYLDHHLCPKIEKKYGKIFGSNESKDKTARYIANVFRLWSEKRAKYYQEKYMCSLLKSEDAIKGHILKYAKKISGTTDSDIFYCYAHLLGQILCWEELSKNYPNICDDINKKKEECKAFLEKCPYMTFFSEGELFNTLEDIVNFKENTF